MYIYSRSIPSTESDWCEMILNAPEKLKKIDEVGLEIIDLRYRDRGFGCTLIFKDWGKLQDFLGNVSIGTSYGYD